MKNFVSLTLIAMLIFVSDSLCAQDTSARFRSTGGLGGPGWQINIDTRYNPIFFMADFSWQFGKKRRNDFLAFYLDPQVNLVHTVRPIDFEFGANIGIRYYQRLKPGLLLYQMLGSGPHYITADLPRQANGFIFSDNLAIGLFKEINPRKKLFLNLQFGVRHISNAGIKLPNSGVNTLNLLIGLSHLQN